MNRIRLTVLATVFGATGTVVASVGECADPGRSEGPRPDLVARVKAGELKVAHASWWGFDAADATVPLQAAIRSGVPKLIVDRMSGPWVVRPLFGVSNQELVFADGVELLAKKGAFLRVVDSLLSYHEATNFVVRGEGRVLFRMNLGDYTNQSVYAKSEWRHGVNLRSVTNARIENLTIRETGGDGIYIGTRVSAGRRCRDVVIRDVVCDANHRQGMSIISVENLLVEDCTFRHTRGSSPESGIDIEPNSSTDVLKNIVIRNCESVDNEGCGYEVMIFHLDRSSEPISIRFENCHSRGNRRKYVFTRPTNPVRGFCGRYEFVNCNIEEMKNPPVSFSMDNSLPVDGAGRTIPIVAADAACLARATVIDSAPGKSVRTSSLAFRGKTSLWLYAAKAGPVVLKGALTRAGGGSMLQGKPLKAVVVSADGGVSIDCLEARAPNGDGTFAFEVPAAGFYSFNFHTGSQKWRFTETTVPLGAYRGRGCREPALNGFTGETWFEVPRGTPSFAFIPAGGGGPENLAVELFAPDGRAIWSADTDGKAALFVSGVNPAAGLWKASIKRPSVGVLDDFSVDVLGVPLCFFLTPEKRWTLK